jgi:hypothetical protein
MHVPDVELLVQLDVVATADELPCRGGAHDSRSDDRHARHVGDVS